MSHNISNSIYLNLRSEPSYCPQNYLPAVYFSSVQNTVIHLGVWSKFLTYLYLLSFAYPTHNQTSSYIVHASLIWPRKIHYLLFSLLKVTTKIPALILFLEFILHNIFRRLSLQNTNYVHQFHAINSWSFFSPYSPWKHNTELLKWPTFPTVIWVCLLLQSHL